jgi:ABC-type siderophore export system fused ATPase/permease subunit
MKELLIGILKMTKIYHILKVLRNIFDWLLQKTTNQTNNTKKLEVSQTEEEKHYEWYIEEQMKNYVDDEKILRWEGEEVKVKDLKERSNGTPD